MESFKPRRKIYLESGQAAEFDTEEILQDTKKRLLDIIEQLNGQFESGEFGMVLGVDSSARVPALLLGKILKHKNPVEMRFVVGNRQLSEEDKVERLTELTEHFSSNSFRGSLANRKVLILDDVLDSGESLDIICKALRAVGIKYQVATLTFHQQGYLIPEGGTGADGLRGQEKVDYLENKLESKIASGDEKTAKIYGKHQMSGVRKSMGIHAVTFDDWAAQGRNTIPDYGGGYTAGQDREVLEVTRERINEIADEVAEQLGWK